MINYVHCHIGQLPPDYLIDSFRSIDNVEPESRIVFVTDQDIEIDNVEILKVSDIASEQTKHVMQMSLFKYDSNQLWRRSIFRVFLVRDAMKHLKMNSCYHFDSDVLMFHPSSKFEHLIDNNDGLTITHHTDSEVVFGFSNFGDIEKIDEICKLLSDIVFDPVKQAEYSNGMPNEMKLLHGIYVRRPELIKKLNILPNDSGIIFDPSSYGQFFGGTDNGHPPGWYGEHHIIGKQISEGNLKPIMVDGNPFVESDGKQYPIMNLHIHSKKTYKFLRGI